MERDRAATILDDYRHGETWLSHTALDGCGPLEHTTDICEHGYPTLVVEAERILHGDSDVDAFLAGKPFGK